MVNDQYDFNGLPGWTRGKVTNPQTNSFLQDCEEQTIEQDLQQFLQLLDQFMTKHHILSLTDMGEKDCLAFLIELRNHELHPIVDVEARNVNDKDNENR